MKNETDISILVPEVGCECNNQAQHRDGTTNDAQDIVRKISRRVVNILFKRENNNEFRQGTIAKLGIHFTNNFYM